MMRILFICGQNKHRSKTAEGVFSGRFETRSAGLWNDHPVTPEQLDWAECVVVMEDEHRIELAKRFPEQYLQKRILSLGILDMYQYMQPELIKELKQKIEEYEL